MRGLHPCPGHPMFWGVLFRGAFAVELATLAAALRFAVQNPARLRTFVLPLAIAIIVFHALPAALWRLASRRWKSPRRRGDGWKVGRYTESQLRRLLTSISRHAPLRLRRFRLFITPERGLGAWTKIPGLLSTGERPIHIAGGMLHYLSPRELNAVLLHEVAHHFSHNGLRVRGGWLLLDLVVVALVAPSLAEPRGSAFTILSWLIGVRAAVAWLGWASLRNESHAVELRCDRFAASHAGHVAMVNALLKCGEESDLIQAVTALAARRLTHRRGIEPIELVEALEEVRPPGQVFHENLFRHAREVVAQVDGERSARGKRPERRPDRGGPLTQYLRWHRESRRPRVRWRRFDAGGKGELSADEIVALGRHLQESPEHSLFRVVPEEQATHPTIRDRILRLIPGVC